MIKLFQAYVLLFLVVFGNRSISQVVELNDYLSGSTAVFDDLNCDCSTQNNFQVPVYLPKNKYPYRGEFAKSSRERLFNDRFKNSAEEDPMFKAIKSNQQVSYYENYWNPEVNNRKPKLIDFNFFRILNFETDLEFSKSVFNNVNSDINSWLIQEQNLQLLQFGEINNYKDLKPHWYNISMLDTKIDSRNLGIYFVVTHYFYWQNSFFSASFKFDHEPNSDDFNIVHQFLLNFGKPCPLRTFDQKELDELGTILKEYYTLAFDKLFPKLLNSEKEEVVSCAVEKLRQYYSFSEITGGLFDEALFDEITTGCVEFMRIRVSN
jgi:hypothetical protein